MQCTVLRVAKRSPPAAMMNDQVCLLSTREQWEHVKGDFFDLSVATEVVSKKNIDCVYTDDDGNDKVLFHLRTNILSPQNGEITWNALSTMAKQSKNNNRGIAAGKIDIAEIQKHRPNFRPSRLTTFRAYGFKPDGTPSKTHVANFARSSVVGWTDARQRISKGDIVPCRLASFTAKNMEKYKAVFPLLREIDAVFSREESARHNLQLNRAKSTVAQIDTTAFSTVTVNYDFRTALHHDIGDFKDGFGCFSVLHSPNDPVVGGELIFPEFGVAIRMTSSDVLLFDSHQWHCNAPLATDGTHRMSLVCYLREAMLNKCQKEHVAEPETVTTLKKRKRE